jgi:hypothetical protein
MKVIGKNAPTTGPERSWRHLGGHPRRTDLSARAAAEAMRNALEALHSPYGRRRPREAAETDVLA